MHGARISILFCVLLILPNIILVNATTISNEKNQIGEGWVEKVDDIIILHQKGTYYEMGYQHGYLLKEQIEENKRAVFNFATEKGITYKELLGFWNIMKNYIPQEYLDEMQGLADGSGLDYEELNVMSMIPTKLAIDAYECSGFVAWGPATKDGKVIHCRSFDYPLWMRDPISGKYIQENQAILIREPENGYASWSPIIIGLYGSGGINENKIGIGSLYSWSKDRSLHGIPLRFRIPMTLDKATNALEAIDLITSNGTMGFNQLVSDAKIPIGYAVEQTKNLTYYGTWDHTIENNAPFWNIDHVLRRTNLFVNPETAATQREMYNPTSILRFILGKNEYYPMWKHYQALSRSIEQNWGTLDLPSALSLVRDTYSGRTDLIIFLVQNFGLINRIATRYGYLQSVNQWVAYPETGDILISFADADKNAWENEIHSYNFYELLNQD
jgi:hypothetical protein